MACPGSVALEYTEPESTSEYADEGTRAHALAAAMLTPDAPLEMSDAYPPEMHDFVRIYADAVQDRVDGFRDMGASVVELHVEQRLPIDHITGEENAEGTADAVIIAQFPGDGGAVLEVRDLKYGMGVLVSPVNNPQLKVYALAALRKFEEQFDFRQVILTIHQPRVSERPLEWQISVADLRAFQAVAKERATIALSYIGAPRNAGQHLADGEHCRFCRALYKCPQAGKTVHESVFGEFQKIEDEAIEPVMPDTFIGAPSDYAALLPTFMRRVPLVEHWCKAIRAKVEEELLRGNPVAGWKLVEGRKGHRKWSHPDEDVLAVLRKAGIKDQRVMSEPELLTPAQVQKILAPNKRAPVSDIQAWSEASRLVTQPDGSPSVAPMDDPRPVFSPAKDSDFESFDASDLV